MPRNVTIVGKFFPEDLKYVKNIEDFDFLLPQSFFGNNNPVDFYDKASRSELIIFAIFGNDMGEYLFEHNEDTRMQDIFKNKSIKKVLWSFDSHHQHLWERKFQKLFNRYYIAHSPYLPSFDRKLSRWLPCCYCHNNIEYLKTRSENIPNSDLDLISPCQIYGIGDRNFILEKIGKILESRGLKFHIGPVGYNEDYTDALLKSRVCLNVSIMDDLNIRNFEAWGLNRVLLTNRVPDHDRVFFDPTHTYFFSRDLSDFEKSLDLAMNDTAKIETASAVLNRHMLIHRYAEILKIELDAHLEVEVF